MDQTKRPYEAPYRCPKVKMAGNKESPTCVGDALKQRKGKSINAGCDIELTAQLGGRRIIAHFPYAQRAGRQTPRRMPAKGIGK